MKNLLSLLERFSKSLNQDSLKKERIVEVVFEKTKVKLSPENLDLKEGVLSLSANPSAKNEISLKETLIKETLDGLYNIKVQRILYK